MQLYKKLILISPVISLFLFASPALAAAPDVAGPWADTVSSSSQGLMKNSLAVPAIRSNPTSALGVAENNTTEGNFFSLGFGGNLVLGFDGGVTGGAMVVESTNPNYPIETAKVEVSADGTTWVMAGNLSQTGSVNLPRSVTCAKYVRITDTSNPANFTDATADGYDVDGVKSTGKPCPKPTPTCAGSKTTIVNQVNKTNIVNSINVSQNTGNNKANNNGSVYIMTGNNNANINVKNVGGSNYNFKN